MDYFKYTRKSRHDKAINTLLGIIHGISTDRTINDAESQMLENWIVENGIFADRHPYNEFIPRIRQALEDHILTEDETEDISWACDKFLSKEYYDDTSAALQELQAIVAAVAVDGVISEVEVEGIQDWISNHEQLKTCWPYDEIESRLIHALKDRWIDPQEHKELLEFFSSFSPTGIQLQNTDSTPKSISGICAVAPEIIFEDHLFCFTGESSKASRDELKVIVLDRGGQVRNSVSPRLNYLVVGSNGNPCWAYACYGRKIEKAVQLRQQGASIVIVHEVDFFDAIA